MLRDWFDHLWPTLAPWTPKDLADMERDKEAEIASVNGTDWSQDVDVAIEEARRYFDSEEDRLKSAKEKATNFILFVGALIPLLTYFAAAIWDKKTWSIPELPSAVVFVISTLYLLRAGLWSFQALRVNTFQRVDVPDLLRVWSGTAPKQALVVEILTSTRANQKPVNEIISCIKMAHAFLQKAFIALVVLLVLEIAVNVFQLHPEKPEPANSSAARNQMWPVMVFCNPEPLWYWDSASKSSLACETPVASGPFTSADVVEPNSP
jgi:hypothetical protein